MGRIEECVCSSNVHVTKEIDTISRSSFCSTRRLTVVDVNERSPMIHRRNKNRSDQECGRPTVQRAAEHVNIGRRITSKHKDAIIFILLILADIYAHSQRAESAQTTSLREKRHEHKTEVRSSWGEESAYQLGRGFRRPKPQNEFMSI